MGKDNSKFSSIKDDLRTKKQIENDRITDAIRHNAIIAYRTDRYLRYIKKDKK